MSCARGPNQVCIRLAINMSCGDAPHWVSGHISKSHHVRRCWPDAVDLYCRLGYRSSLANNRHGPIGPLIAPSALRTSQAKTIELGITRPCSEINHCTALVEETLPRCVSARCYSETHLKLTLHLTVSCCLIVGLDGDANLLAFEGLLQRGEATKPLEREFSGP